MNDPRLSIWLYNKRTWSAAKADKFGLILPVANAKTNKPPNVHANRMLIPKKWREANDTHLKTFKTPNCKNSQNANNVYDWALN